MENEDSKKWRLTPEQSSRVARGHRAMAALPHSEPIDCVNCPLPKKKPDDTAKKDTR